jgi:hypothetical protein
MKSFYKAVIAGVIGVTCWCGLSAKDMMMVAAHADNGSVTRDGLEPGPGADRIQARHFDAEIAPLLARHCFECHDSTSRQGGLDLSRKDAMFELRAGEAAVVPGDLEASLLWDYVESGDMPPPDRPPMSAEEIELLREWILNGAVWSGDVIDPLALVRDRRAAERWVLRLTVPEYIETVRSAVGVDVERDARRLLPRDLRADGFSNTGYNLSVDLAHVEAYADLAERIVERMDVPGFAAEHTPAVELTFAEMSTVVEGVGRWLLRGPLERHEIDSFLAVAKAVEAEGGDVTEAVGYVIEAMLQAPRFLYRIESHQTDGVSRLVNDYELASRLSYLLWGGPPDGELLRAADAGELNVASAVEAQVRRMFQDPRVMSQSARFVHEWLDLGRLDNLRPNPDRFPHWTDRLAADMVEETLAYFHEVAWAQRRPLWDLLNAQVSHLTPRLAEHYGVELSKAELNTTGAVYARPTGIPEPIPTGLQARYTFEEGRGEVIHDVSGAEDPIHLEIADLSAVEWNDEGLKVTGSTLIASPAVPSRMTEAIRATGEITIEAWITPANTNQAGPARLVSLSSGASQRNITLGQDGGRFEVRLRSSATSANGLPGVQSVVGSAGTQRTQVVYSRDAEGQARMWVDGKERGSGKVGGDLSNWDDGFQLMLANETTLDREWRGTFHSVAIYSLALSPEELASGRDNLARYNLESVPERGGLLTQGSVLTVGGDEASMVTRGLFILHDFLYSTVGSAPPGVDTTPVPTKPGLSQRGAAEARLADASCVGCHSRFEPFAFGLERFDGLGSYVEVDEHGNQLRQDGEILFPGESESIAYTSVPELMDLLAASERVRMNITRKVTQFALGRPLVESDAQILGSIHAQAHAGGGTYESLLLAIATSDLVRYAR